MTLSVVPRLWPGSTVVCVGTGPSLTHEDLAFCRDKARMIVVNNAYTWAPWADVMYACDDKYWKWEKGAPAFQGLKYSLLADTTKWPDVHRVKSLGRFGLSLDPGGLKTGHDSGYQAINVAVLFGAVKVLLLGYDMQVDKKKDHCFGSHPDGTKPPFALCLQAYKTLVEPLSEAGVEVINCTPGSALRCFPTAPLRQALMERAA